VGRLFDAVAALVGVRQTVTYEAQAAIELESLAADTPGGYDIPLLPGEPLRLDPRPLVRRVARDRIAGVPAPVISGRFHSGLAAAVVRVCRAVRDRTGVNTVGLTGGTFQNMLLLRLVVEAMRRDGFGVLVHRQVPANDGGLSLGQAIVARAVLAAHPRGQ
jgi:hydrogenase maturation protein HypF